MFTEPWVSASLQKKGLACFGQNLEEDYKRSSVIKNPS